MTPTPSKPQDSAKNIPKQKRMGVSFSDVSIIEFPYAVGDTPCSAGVPIGASYEAQHQTTFSLDFFEKHRPARRPKASLHISALDRKALLLKSGHSAREIAAATRDAMRVRKQRAETIRALRSRMQSLSVAEANNAAKFDSTLGMNEPTSPVTSPCPSPVTTSPIRSNGRTRWTPCRQDQPLQPRRRRLSETRSPMPLKIRTDGNINNNSKARPPVLSPLRTNTKLSFDEPMLNSPNVMSPGRGSVHSPTPVPTRRSPLCCLSPKMAGGNQRMWNDDDQYRNPGKQTVLTPSKRPLTPVKTTTPGDRPLSIPKRVRTPPPPCRIRATRMF